MTTADPISLAQAKRLAADADTVLLRATRPADLETPIGAFLRLDDGGPAYLLESVEGGERTGRYSFLGVGPRRLLEVRDGQARIQTRPVTVREYAPDLPFETVRGARSARGHPGLPAQAPRPAGRGHAALHGRRGRRPGLRRGQHLRAARAAARARPGRRPDGRLHRDRPGPRLRPPDPHPVGHRLAAHRDARLRGPLPDRRGGHLRGPRAHPAPQRGRAGRRRPAQRHGRHAVAGRPHRHLARSRPVHPRGRGGQGRHRQRRGHPGRARPAPVVRPAARCLDRRPARRHRAVPGAAPGQPQPVPVLRAHPAVRGRGRVAGAAAAGPGRQDHDPSHRRHAARAARTSARTSSWPSSSRATPRNGPST